MGILVRTCCERLRIVSGCVAIRTNSERETVPLKLTTMATYVLLVLFAVVAGQLELGQDNFASVADDIKDVVDAIKSILKEEALDVRSDSQNKPKVTTKIWNGYTTTQYETLFWTLKADIQDNGEIISAEITDERGGDFHAFTIRGTIPTEGHVM